MNMKKLAVFAAFVGSTLSLAPQAATSYAYDELNRLTKVTYDDGRSISYVYDAAGNMSSRVSSSVSLARSFVEEFDGTTLDLTKWNVVASFGGGRGAVWSVGGGALSADVPGGSCGSCGTTDGSSFVPKMAAFGGDFEMVLSVGELFRTQTGGYRDHSGLRLYYGPSSWIALLGNYSHVMPGYAYATYVGHRVIAYGSDGAVCFLDDSFSLNTMYTMDLRIRRSGSVTAVGYRLQGTPNWVERSCPLPNTGAPVIDLVSGDGGGTSRNGRVGLRLDRFEVDVGSSR